MGRVWKTIGIWGAPLCFLPGLVESSESLTWKACIDLTLKNNSELKAASSSLQASEYERRASRSGFFPQVSASFGLNRSNSVSGSGLTGDDPNDVYSVSLSASQNLFAGFQDTGKIRQSQANTEVAQAGVGMTKARVGYELKSAFASLQYAKEFSRLMGEIIHRREENLKLVELRFRGGHENKGSVLLSEAYLNQARYDALLAENAKRVSWAQLASVLGVDELEPREIEGEIPFEEPSRARPNFKELALITPEYKQSLGHEEAADAAIAIARAQFFPSLNLSGSMGRQSNEFFPQTENRWSLGLSLSIPLFSGGKSFYATKGASASGNAASEQRVNLSRELLTKLERAYSDYLQAAEKLKVDASFKKAAAVRAEIARSRYHHGLLSFENWDLIESDLISREKNYLQSRRDRVIAEAYWEQAQGRGVIP